MLALKQNPSSPHITAAIIVNNVLAVLISTTAIAARFISKRRIRSGFLADDYLIGTSSHIIIAMYTNSVQVSRWLVSPLVFTCDLDSIVADFVESFRVS